MPPKSKKKDPEKPVVDDQFQQLDVTTRDPHTVVLMLDSPETAVVCKACEALHKHMEKSEQNCLELKDHDIIPRLVRLLASPDKATRSYGILCLSVMATNSSVRKVLYRTDCIPPLLALLRPEEEVICHERASYTLAQVAAEYSFKVALQKHSAHEPLIRLLQQSTDPDVQRNCLKSLSLLVEHYQSRPAVQEAGGLPVLLELLASEYAVIQELALRTLHSCLQNAGCRATFREADGLAKIVAFIGNKDYADLHVLAVSLLALCLEEGGQMAALQASDTLQQLLAHISNGSGPEMKRNAAMALSRAARNAVNVKILHEQEAEKTFIQLLSSEDAGVSVAGSDGLTAMALLSSSRAAIGQWGGVEGLVKGVGREEGPARAAAAQALAQVLTEAPANCKRVSGCGGVEEVVRLLGDGEARCRSFAADCVSSMAADDSLRASLISARAVEALVGCLQFPDSAVQTGSSEAIAMLACDAAAREQFSGSGGVAPLLSLLRSPHDTIRQTAVWTLSVCAQSAEVAHQACQSGGLELVQQLCSTPGRHTASATAALGKLLDSNLAAKYWITGRLDQSDIITSNCEFFDAGPAQSSGPFVPLSELASRPLNMNHPILTVALLAPGGKPPAPPPPSSDDHLDLSQSTVSITSRSKSRNAPAKGKKGRGDREVEPRVDTEELPLPPAPEKPPGLLPPDPTLWQHVTHARTHVLPLPSTKEQVQELARYVSDSMGGVVKKVGAFGYELPAGESQQERRSNLLPLGEVTAGVFQHRSLLFKVLCDQLGVGCSLVRGEYGRHWNEVTLMEERRPKSFVVDLVYSPGQLLATGSPEVMQYHHI